MPMPGPTVLSRRSFVTGLGGAMAATGLSTLPRVARAATTLTFSSWLPPMHPIVVHAFRPWADQVAEVTDGRVNIRILPSPLGTAPSHFEMARYAAADITYGLHSFMPGDRFLLTQAAEFSFLADDAETLSVAYWNLHRKHFARADEHAGTHVLGLFTHGPAADRCYGKRDRIQSCKALLRERESRPAFLPWRPILNTL